MLTVISVSSSILTAQSFITQGTLSDQTGASEQIKKSSFWGIRRLYVHVSSYPSGVLNAGWD
ncbi:hypothetical protein NBRC111894_4212 [Sporolactobacillus inulinus]|uniref:Uncharacterized protein n=1 Tax=Sporolactobacillus inulinus TaxID=2078 RepID=A0A4Y1ZJP2_9BACL|nr:hypothetical protein NBRC111894_4212 [Sporolactobacillus inulinus]